MFYAGGPKRSLLLSARRIAPVRSRVAVQHDFNRRSIATGVHIVSFRVTTMDEIIGPLCCRLVYRFVAGLRIDSSPL